MARTDPQINIRLPLALKERLGVAARANQRTMNAEIVQRLEASLVSIVVKKNSAEAGIIWELHHSMQSLKAEVADLGESLMKVIKGWDDPETGVPDFTDVKGMAIRQTRHIVGELQEAVKALTKSRVPKAGTTGPMDAGE
jgi:hypothetical protein